MHPETVVSRHFESELISCTLIWLTHILSEANHRLNHVEPWVEQRLHTLRSGTGRPVHPLDLSDDRLAGVLEVLSQDAPWQAFEGALHPAIAARV